MQRTEREQRAPLRRFTYSRRGYDVIEVDRFVAEVERQFETAMQRIQLLEGQLDQLSHENAALTQMINHVARLGEQMVADARKEAHEIVAGARTEAQERVVVARADAKTLVSEERRKVADELEMLAVVRETVVAERDALLSFHSDLNNRLREIVTSIVNYSDDEQIHELAAIGGIIAPELVPSRPDDATTTPAHDYVVEPDNETAVAVSAPPAPTAGPQASDAAFLPDRQPPSEVPGPPEPSRFGAVEDAHDPFADEHFDRAFSSFMGSEADVEPSRHWMISGE
jgi:cell division septum initiation protein DivIVA